MKIAFGMIVFEGDYVLRECLEQVYPFASQILIAEGPVSYWQSKGRTTSTDATNSILDNFPDPDNKIKIVHSRYEEKDDQCRAYMCHINDDIDYLWNLDSDEVYTTEDLTKMIKFLEEQKPTSVGVKSCTFYGGFDNTLSGFENNTDNFLRVFRYMPGSTWLTHRPPTMKYPQRVAQKHINSDELYRALGVQMYHYSYVFPQQVERKISYYKDRISKSNCIDNYFDNVYLPWVTGDETTKNLIQTTYRGVHEFVPRVRGDCFAEPFFGKHPESITNNFETLKRRFDAELTEYVKRKS